jgi:hypothetical protein
MSEAKKGDKSPILLRLKNPIPREDMRRFDGLTFVGRHPGVEKDGFDMGWYFAAPVGMGGFPDDWFVGWRPLELEQRYLRMPWLVREFEGDEKAVIKDLAEVLSKHGLECGWAAEHGAEFLFLCLDAQMHLEFRHISRITR